MALSGTLTTSKTTAAGSGYPGYVYLKWSATQNIINNTSTISWYLYGGSDYSSTTSRVMAAPITVTINGTTVLSKTDRFQLKKDALIGSGTITVNHASDGTKSVAITINAAIYTYAVNCTYSGSITLNTIDRAAPTVTLTTSGITASGVTVKATASTTCDRWDYSIDGGSSWTNFSTTSDTSASKSITGLAPNTTYSIKVRARKSTNQVYGTSAASSVKTLGGSVISSISTFTADATTAKITMSVTVYNTSYTHTLVIKNGSTTVLTISSLSLANGSNTITLTAAQRSTILAAMSSIKSFTGTFTLTTYSGSMQIGTASSKTATVQTTAANSAPTFSGFTYADTNSISVAVTGNDQTLIQNISTLVITAAAATARNGATISSYSAVAGNTTASSTTTTITVGKISSSGTVAVVVTAIDSRGYTTSTTVNITVIAYENIAIKNYSMRRVNEVEDTIQAAISGSIKAVTISGTNKNSLKYARYRYRKTSDSSWGSWVYVTSATSSTDSSFSYSNDELVDLDADYSYYVQFRVDDQLTYDSVTITIPQGTPLLAFRRKKVGVNQREPSAALDVSGNIMMNGLNVLGLVATLGNTEDFNDLTAPGIYTQSQTANASTDRNYPAKIAGFLEVIANTSGYILQRYTAYNCSGVYIRYRYNGTWYAWKSITLS